MRAKNLALGTTQGRAGDAFRVGMVVFDGMTLLDTVGPADIFARVPGVEIVMFARSTEPVTTDSGIRLIPDLPLAEALDVDLLFVGGGPGTIYLLDDDFRPKSRRNREMARHVSSPRREPPHGGGPDMHSEPLSQTICDLQTMVDREFRPRHPGIDLRGHSGRALMDRSPLIAQSEATFPSSATVGETAADRAVDSRDLRSRTFPDCLMGTLYSEQRCAMSSPGLSSRANFLFGTSSIIS